MERDPTQASSDAPTGQTKLAVVPPPPMADAADAADASIPSEPTKAAIPEGAVTLVNTASKTPVRIGVALVIAAVVALLVNEVAGMVIMFGGLAGVVFASIIILGRDTHARRSEVDETRAVPSDANEADAAADAAPPSQKKPSWGLMLVPSIPLLGCAGVIYAMVLSFLPADQSGGALVSLAFLGSAVIAAAVINSMITTLPLMSDAQAADRAATE